MRIKSCDLESSGRGEVANKRTRKDKIRGRVWLRESRTRLLFSTNYHSDGGNKISCARTRGRSLPSLPLPTPPPSPTNKNTWTKGKYHKVRRVWWYSHTPSGFFFLLPNFSLPKVHMDRGKVRPKSQVTFHLCFVVKTFFFNVIWATKGGLYVQRSKMGHVEGTGGLIFEQFGT